MGEITIREFPLYFVPLESDLLSLELDKAFEELYLVSTSSEEIYLKRIFLPDYKKSEKTIPPYIILHVHS